MISWANAKTKNNNQIKPPANAFLPSLAHTVNREHIHTIPFVNQPLTSLDGIDSVDGITKTILSWYTRDIHNRYNDSLILERHPQKPLVYIILAVRLLFSDSKCQVPKQLFCFRCSVSFSFHFISIRLLRFSSAWPTVQLTTRMTFLRMYNTFYR